MKIDLSKAINIEPFNTNNSWGFGGGCGNWYTFPSGHRLKKGKAYFRHLKPEPFERYFDENMKEISADQFRINPEKMS